MSDNGNNNNDKKPEASATSGGGGGDLQQVDKELVDILENEATNYDSDGVARGHSPGRPPSVGSSAGSVGSRDSRGKRRTWKKPKDKPKRPLSAYNIFFKHERSRIVEGRDEDATADEVIRSIENILSTSRETRRHRKTHGRISFGDLARKIAEKWKAIVPEHKAVFEHYAELDMRRYRKEVKLWKEKKEQEGLDGRGSAHDSTSGCESVPSEFSIEHHISGGSQAGTNDAWAPRKNFYDQMNSSFSSSCSVDSEISLEPIPIGDMLMKARPNFHNSMPALDTGVPGEIQGTFQAAVVPSNDIANQMMAYGNQSLTNMHFSGGGGDMMQMQQPNMVTSAGGSSNNPLSPQQIIQQQQELIRRQQQMLEQQRESLQMQQQRQQFQLQQQMQQGFNTNNMNFQQQQQQFQQMQQQMQPDMARSRGGGGMGNSGGGSSGRGGGNNTVGATELDGFLSNLDLSNV